MRSLGIALVAISAAMIAAGILLIVWGATAHAETQSMIKTVPEGSSVNYIVDGRVVQSMTLRAGTYRLTIEEMPTRAGAARPKRERQE